MIREELEDLMYPKTQLQADKTLRRKGRQQLMILNIRKLNRSGKSC